MVVKVIIECDECGEVTFQTYKHPHELLEREECPICKSEAVVTYKDYYSSPRIDMQPTITKPKVKSSFKAIPYGKEYKRGEEEYYKL